MMLVKIGWDMSIVLPVKDAVALAEMLSKAYAWDEKRKGSDTLYYCYPNERNITMTLLNDDLVSMAKVAGKPEKE